MRDPARAYRESAVRGASPVGLIVILYEEVIRSLRRAMRSLQENNIEQKTLALTHALEVISHLQVTLNFKAGGEVANSLSHFYNMARAKIIEANLSLDRGVLESVVTDFSALAQAWQEADKTIGNANISSEDVIRIVSRQEPLEVSPVIR